jgi:hypothetical protein
MRMTMPKTLVFLGGIALLAWSGTAAAEGRACLHSLQIKYTHMVDGRTMIATDNRNDRYQVRFTGECRVGAKYTWNHFIYTDLQVDECLARGMVLPTTQLGPCFIESVTPLRDNG